jgi:excinuclease UvrABC ATPase subunit
VLKEINERLRFLLDVGLDYLSLEPADRRRCPAARRSGSGWPPRSAPGWSGVLYVLDEPSSACTSATTAG